MKSIALANQKGGVGKTTTAIHLAHGLALAGCQVALFDLDPQGNATLAVQGMAIDHQPDSEENSRDLLTPLEGNWWILQSPGAHRNIGRDTAPPTEQLAALADSLAADGFDWLIVDCPPRMDAWGWAGLELCEDVLLPVQSEFFAIHGLSQMMQTLEVAQKKLPGKAKLTAVVPTLVDAREPIALEVVRDLRRNLGSLVTEAMIFRDSKFIEAASHGKTLFSYQLDSKGARAYGELAREVLYGRTT